MSRISPIHLNFEFHSRLAKKRRKELESEAENVFTKESNNKWMWLYFVTSESINVFSYLPTYKTQLWLFPQGFA